MFLFRDKSNCNIVEERDDSTYFRFDFSHHYKVWKRRKELGLPVTNQIKLDNHKLIGNYICDITDDTVYIVEMVYKEWYGGWCIKLLLRDCEGSHRVSYWENINCFYPTIVNSVEKNKRDLKILDKM